MLQGPSALAAASGLLQEPMAPVAAVATDPSGRWWVMAGGDDGRLEFRAAADGSLIWRVRLGVRGKRARIHAVAVAPRGHEVAVAAVLEDAAGENVPLVLILPMDPRQKVRVAGRWSQEAQALAWSWDGARLAVGLAGGAGVQILDQSAEANPPLTRHLDPGEVPRHLAFDAPGRLLVLTQGGGVRLYAADGHLEARETVTGAGGPRHGEFSPQGAWLALSGGVGALFPLVPGAGIHQPTPGSGAGAARHLAWEAGSPRLWGADNATGVLQVWEESSGETPSRTLNTPLKGVKRILPFPAAASRLLLQDDSGRPWLLDTEGRVIWHGDVGGLEWDVASGMGVSATGRLVAWGVVGRDRPLAFDWQGGLLDLASRQGLGGHLSRGEGLRVERVERGGRERWFVEGRALRPPLPGKVVRQTLIPDQSLVVFVTESGEMVAYGESGRRHWQRPAAAVLDLAPSRDGLWLVVARAGGMTEWLDSLQGTQRLFLWVHANQKDWLGWDPQGHFDGSKDGLAWGGQWRERQDGVEVWEPWAVGASGHWPGKLFGAAQAVMRTESGTRGAPRPAGE
ncbi:MAG: WD40 repeat domain-containing protein [Magnetococcus sp. WYHC-3]